jgi:hypothetical protein
MRGFSKISKLSYSSVHKLKCKTINSYNGWIFLGRYNSEFVLPKNLDIIYRNVLNRHKKYYAFYKNENNHFVGTVGEFIDKYKLKRDNIKGIVDQSRQSASDWICLGECDIHYTFPNNIDEIYKKRLSVNKRKHI